MSAGPWREPADETTDYPKLWVHDGRVTGQVTVGQSRLPLSSILTPALYQSWDDVEAGWSPSTYEFGHDDLASFVDDLLQCRGDLARLLCVLADVERREREREEAILEAHADEDGFSFVKVFPTDDPDSVDLGPAWWEVDEDRQRVVDALTRCLEWLRP